MYLLGIWTQDSIENKINSEKAGKVVGCIWTEEEGGVSSHGQSSPNKMMFWTSGTKIIV